MKYHRLQIYTNGSQDNYNAISKLLGVQPTEFPESKFDNNPFDIWIYSVDIADEDPYFDFINQFLDILEPKFSDLEKMEITRDNISFWLLYEYYEQCGMEYHPKEMKRLGESEIVLCIDCWQRNTEIEL
ncbi:hypothetical protein V6R21_08920 [Limibacter armeniacum]|uniref:hypothetical protein n=1 Tax=Limibacter armeniacum TaxID=466084 RepID=UPI002FE59E37